MIINGHHTQWGTSILVSGMIRKFGVEYIAFRPKDLTQIPRYFTEPNIPDNNYVEGFQGSRIPVHGPTVVKLIEDRVAGLL